MTVRSIQIFPVILATFEEKLVFCASFVTFWTPKTKNQKNLRYDF